MLVGITQFKVMKATIGSFFLILGILALSFLPREAAQEIKSTPNNKVINWVSEKHNHLLSRMEGFYNLVQNEDTPPETIRQSFHKLKNTFKEIEFIYYYLDPQSFSVGVNGAPLPKLKKKVPDMTVIPPQGFQRIEELIYENGSSAEIAMHTEKLSKKVKAYERLLTPQYMTDPVIFESIRYGIIRTNTMAITGFDAPGNTDVSLKDAAMFFHSVRSIAELYSDYYPKDQLNHITSLCNRAKIDLEKATFEDFDRYTFIQTILDPLWRKTLELQNTLQIELPSQRFSKLQRPVNYQANSLYAEDFLNTDYFSEYTGPHQREKSSIGRKLFFDKRLSKTKTHSCASCHHPKKSFTDGLPLSKNLTDGGPGKRNSPSLINAVYADRYFHDLRVDRLAFQMDHVVLNPIEFNSRYDTIISRLREDKQLLSAFTTAYGKEGITKNTITNAMSSFVASLTSFQSSFDKAIRNEDPEIDQQVKKGFNLFMGKATCATCHFPPTFSGLLPPEYAENESEVLGVPSTSSAPYSLDEDLGRYMNHILKEQASFYKNAFKTPTVRNMKTTAPYMHNGVYETLEEVIEFYNVGGGIGLGIDVPNQTLPPDSLHLTASEKRALIRFLHSLEDNPFQTFDQ